MMPHEEKEPKKKGKEDKEEEGREEEEEEENRKTEKEDGGPLGEAQRLKFYGPVCWSLHTGPSAEGTHKEMS